MFLDFAVLEFWSCLQYSGLWGFGALDFGLEVRRISWASL